MIRPRPVNCMAIILADDSPFVERIVRMPPPEPIRTRVGFDRKLGHSMQRSARLRRLRKERVELRDRRTGRLRKQSLDAKTS